MLVAHLPPLPQLLPLLLESLACEEGGLRVSTLEGLLSLIHDVPHIISEHVPSLVPRLLDLARAPDSMVRGHVTSCDLTVVSCDVFASLFEQKVRMAALQCVGALTTLPHHVVGQLM